MSDYDKVRELTYKQRGVEVTIQRVMSNKRGRHIVWAQQYIYPCILSGKYMGKELTKEWRYYSLDAADRKFRELSAAMLEAFKDFEPITDEKEWKRPNGES